MEPNTPMYPSNAPAQAASFLEGPVTLLKYGWHMFKAHWKILVPIMAFPTAVTYVGNILSVTGSAAFMAISFIFILAGIIFSIAMQAASVDAIRSLDENPTSPITFRQAYKTGFSMFWSFILLMIIEGLMVLGSTVIIIIPGIIMAVYSGMYVFTRVIDGKRGFSALTSSYELVKGRWWATFGRILFLVLVYAICAIIMYIVAWIIMLIFGATNSSVGGFVITLITNLVLISVMGPLAMAYIYRLYTSLKSTKSATANTSAFKKWVIAFMVVGVLVPIVAAISAITLSSLAVARSISKSQELGTTPYSQIQNR